MLRAVALALAVGAAGGARVEGLGATPTTIQDCSIDLNFGGQTYRLTTYWPLPAHADIIRTARELMDLNGIKAGAGCADAECVANRIADRIYARCAVNEYAHRVARLQDDLEAALAANVDDSGLIEVARNRTTEKCAPLGAVEVCARVRTPVLAYTDRPVVARGAETNHWFRPDSDTP